MKKQILLTLGILAGSLFATNAEPFVHEFIHIQQQNADEYIVSQKNVRKYTEWQNPPVTYWGPTENGVDAEIIFKFPINKKGTPLHLVANLASFNFDNRGGGRGTGSSSIWGSKDGKTWTLLLDNPIPDRIDSYKTYDQQLPKELLSGSEVWIQVRLRAEGAPKRGYTTAQFSRSDSKATAPVFLIREAAPEVTNARTTRPNSFMIQSFQAGSTTEIDNLKVTDLDTGLVVYENTFSAPADATRGLDSYYWPEGGKDTQNFVKNGLKTRIDNGKLILETTGFNQNGNGGYDSHTETEYSETLPANFRLEFTARRLQWPGHFHLMIYRKEPSDSVGTHTPGGAFSSSRPGNLPLDIIRVASSGDWFQELGILTHFGTPKQTWAQKFPAPAGSPQETHKIAVELNNNQVSYYLNDNLLKKTQVSGWELGANQSKQKPTPQPNSADSLKQQPAPTTSQETAPQQFRLEELLGANLINSDGSPVNPASLKGKFVGIYFSAHWCGPCRKFTPKLVEFRNQIPDQFDVVFASSDRDAAAMLSYMKEAGMPWPALPFGSPQKALLDSIFNIRSIPTLIVLDPDGRIASRNARNDVATLSPKDALAKWKNDTTAQKPEKLTYSAPSIVSSAKTTSPQNASIDPGKSLLGCPIGSSEEEVIKILGKPFANFRLSDNETALLYFNGTAMLRFIEGKLTDGQFSSGSILDIRNYSNHKTPYSLPNGISIGNSLKKAKDILGERLDLNKDFYHSSYIDGDFLISFNCSSQYGKDRNNIGSYTIYSIDIKEYKSVNISKSIDLGKSIFGCAYGSTEAEIIKTLGEPEGKVNLDSNKIGLFYHNSRALLILWDGVLGGGLFQESPMLRNQSSYSPDITISMTNGIALEGPLAKVKEVLGETFEAGESLYQITYQEGDSLITIQSSSRHTPGVPEEDARKDINNYTIRSIQIDPFSKAQVRSPSAGCGIPPKKSFPARQNPEKFNPTEMITVEGGTLSEKANLAGTKVESFQIAKYEVTNAEWMKIQSYAQKHGYALSRPTRTNEPELPMEGVSRREAMLWCNAKSEKEGLQPVYWQGGQIYKSEEEEPEMNLNANGYRLPTEPEWEWAARGGILSKGYKFSGGDNMNEVAWNGSTGEKWARPVGTKKPNELGIHDMSGNVYEWVWDIDIPTFGILGGSYMGGPDDLDLNYRSAGPLRKFARETGRARSLGFRLARNIPRENTPSLPSLPEQKQEPPKSPSAPKQNAKQQPPVEKLLAPQQVESLMLPNWFKTPARPQNILIDPGKSIFGCAYGSSVQEVSTILGPPTCVANYTDDSVEMFYGDDCILYFDEGKLCGVSINDVENALSNILDRSAGNFAAPRFFHITNTYSGGWMLSNGIHPMMELTKARNRLPEKHDETLKSLTINDQNVSLQTTNIRNRDYIQSIKVLPSSFVAPQRRGGRLQTDLNFVWANPSRSIADCPLGATKSEIIDKIGPPIATLDLGQKWEALLYDNGMTLLLLFEDKLAGGEFRSTSHGQDENPFQLSNGIHLGMPLSKAKEILGEKLVSQYIFYYNRYQKMKYIDGPSLVILSSEINWSLKNSTDRDINSYEIKSIQIAPISSAIN